MISPRDLQSAEGPDGWRLTAEGAAVHAGERTAVIADVHLGYEWARAAGGDVVPAHSLEETRAKLATLLDRAPIARLVVAGDLVESPRPCPRTDRDVRRLVAWLEARGVELVWLMGDHDPRRVPPLPSRAEVAGWTIAHGSRPIAAPRTISGHHHPALRAEGRAFPCFLVGPATIVLPAFSCNAAGLDIRSGRLAAIGREGSLRCLACSGDGGLMDLGPLATLVARPPRPGRDVDA
jgi:uncharacterized protein